MKHPFKTLLVALLCFGMVVGTGGYALLNSMPGPVQDMDSVSARVTPGTGETITAEDRSSLARMTEKSERVNVLLIGTDGGRSDTMMLVSYDPKQKLMDIVSVPRDTYHPAPEHPGAASQKLNAVYGFKGEEGGAVGVSRAVESLLKVPVHYHVEVDYDAVREIVDLLGGVPVEIDAPMDYDDPYDKPPLHIHFKPGKVTLTGDEAVKYLRWRKNNGEEGEGDLARIGRQQAFVKAAMERAMSMKLPKVIATAFKHLKTDMPANEMIRYGLTMVGMDKETLRSSRVPGEVKRVDDLSCLVHDPEATERMMLEIYNRGAAEAVMTPEAQ